MKRVIIGHRGVGKTSFLNRHKIYFSDVPHFDLDAKIEISQNKKISDLFQSYGETHFRQIEKQVFSAISKGSEFVISVGAGFDCQNIPNEVEVLYVSRRTDRDGRIFLNRPRLNPELDPLTESIQRYSERDPKYRQRADLIYHMPEGISGSNEIERILLTETLQNDSAYLTSVPNKLKQISQFQNIELRTDLFSTEEIKKIISENKNQFLISYRKATQDFPFRSGLIDWALELGPVPDELHSSDLIVSNHDDSIRVAIEKFNFYKKAHQKLCPVVFTWEELLIGDQWQNQDPQNRSFLPRSAITEKRSKWRWYRELQFAKQKINFIQGFQDFDDQPSLYEYLKSKNKPTKNFAAVIGDPVHHSWTPYIQDQNFSLNVLAIPIAESEFNIAIPILEKWGIKALAVTSPLKMAAGRQCNENQSFNSLVFKNNQWIGTSTDQDGLKNLIESVPNIQNLNIAVWGGGGVLESVQQVLPKAQFYSAQTQRNRIKTTEIQTPDVVIWAAPRKSGIQWPPTDWPVQYVVDLNYMENSMGLEYAQRINAKYFSGVAMFLAQAQKQLEFWKEHLKEN
jgi:shikimate 5-dehydrogenase/shikimate kinase